MLALQAAEGNPVSPIRMRRAELVAFRVQVEYTGVRYTGDWGRVL